MLPALFALLALFVSQAGLAGARSLNKIIVNSGESIQCPAGEAACSVSIQAFGHDRRHRRLKLGNARLTIAPNATAPLLFTLSRAGRRLLLLTHGPLRATLMVSVRHGTDAPIRSTHAIAIGVPKHGRRTARGSLPPE